MAELTNDQKGGGKKERRSIRNRPMPKVDLTAMVDLAFLLITFFMLTTSLNTPHQLDIAMPDKNKGPITAPILLSEDRVLNLLLGEDRKSTRLNSSHVKISYAVFCLKKKNTNNKN